MKIALFTMGTRGDVQPYIYLAKALKKHGHETTIGSHPCWRRLVEDAGISFAPIGPDIDIEEETSIIRGKTQNAVISLLKTMNFIFKIIENSSPEIYESCKGKDLIIVSHSQMGAAEAEALQIPAVNVTLQTEMIPQALKEPTFGDKLFNLFVGPKITKPYNKIRKLYNLPMLKNSAELISGKINLIPISKYVKERNKYWEDKNILTGYWYEEADSFEPPAELTAFLAKGEKPMILALGAMSFENKADRAKLDLFVNAFKKTDKRAIIQGFQKTLKNYELPETMIACGSVPHSWLFRQGYAVIHHCGFGTASAAMIYGIPSIPVPFILDQTGFAMQLEQNNVAVKMIQAKDLSEERLIEAINELDANYAAFSQSAKALSEKLQSEHGLETAVELIEKCLES